MSKRINAKYKIGRSLGCNLWGSSKSSFNVRNSIPGEHGNKPKRLTEYARQLQSKQRLRKYYGNISESQFRSYYKLAVRMKGDSSENLIKILESRLDIAIYRLKLAPTVFAARQFINHGHILVNDKRVNIASFRLKPEDKITLKESSKNLASVLLSREIADRDVPDYLSIDEKSLQSAYLRYPVLSEVPYAVQMLPDVVIAFYSR